MMVIARQGLKVPLEDDARRYITDSEPVTVADDSAYILRRLLEGDLLPADVPFSATVVPATSTEKSTTPSAPARKAAAEAVETGADAPVIPTDKKED